jgi:hypothetical protein
MTADERKQLAYDTLFVFVAEEGGENRYLPVDKKITVFHEFFRLFRQEFITDLDFQEFTKEEFKQLNFR